MSIKRLIVCWLAGLLTGTMIVAVSSPFFVRSYLPQQFDAVRAYYVPSAGNHYRWRSEGYATTVIGAHGMPGRPQVPAKDKDSIRVALWGDSQAEGVCVADEEKLFAQIERVAAANGKTITVLPFARSGDDAADWLMQIPSVERPLAIDFHLMVIVDLPDLETASDAPLTSSVNQQSIEWKSEVASALPAFLIQTVRHLVTDQEGNRRRLRFSVGPAKAVKPGSAVPREQVNRKADWQSKMRAIRNVSDRPIIILYAPKSPHIAGGKIILHDSQTERFQQMERAAIVAGVRVVDASDALGNAAREGRWPHGFHNGQIGSGHLNTVGYQVIAEKVANALNSFAKSD